eukprot:NODE_939_length_2687_cov_10.812109.p1 GENE.NODE_939_length_2687_cov_10.812109~~NODE_939_length_2687_cov_10.812109.p1  ORF type:complete len:549 (-),score=78.81 NODE_939_length_2687_cov_10.812109:926-2572(-)
MKFFAALAISAAIIQGMKLSGPVEEWKNVTLEEAMAQLPGMSKQLRSLVQRRIQMGGGFLQTDPQAAAEEAKLMLNGMLEEAEEKLENTTENCKQSIASLKKMLATSNTNMASIRATLATAVATKSYNSHKVQTLQTDIPALREASRKYAETCEDDTRAFRAAISVLNNDSTVIWSLIEKMDCNAQALMLMHCHGNHSKESLTVLFANRSLHDQVGKLHSRKVAERVHRALKKSYGPAQKKSLVQSRQIPGASTIEPSGCSIANSPVCPKIVDRFHVIAAAIQDKLRATHSKLQKRTAECTTRLAYDEAMLGEKTTLLGDHTAKMGDATALITSSREDEETTQERLDDLNAQLTKLEAYCHGEKKKFTSEVCALNKIRDELFTMSGLKPEFVQDCVVSAWVVTGACTATCGGGTETRERDVVTQSEGGAACPLLQEVALCNVDPCPIDCVMDDWSGGARAAQNATVVSRRGAAASRRVQTMAAPLVVRRPRGLIVTRRPVQCPARWPIGPLGPRARRPVAKACSCVSGTCKMKRRTEVLAQDPKALSV